MESQERGESRGPIEVLDATLTYLANHNLDTRVIIGSVRKPEQVIQAFEQGADIVTVPPKILERIMFTTRAQETVEQFDAAYQAVRNDPRLKLI